MDPLTEEGFALDALDAWQNAPREGQGRQRLQGQAQGHPEHLQGAACSSSSGRARCWWGQGPQAVQGHLPAHREIIEKWMDRALPDAQRQGVCQDHAEKGGVRRYLETGRRLQTHDSQGGFTGWRFVNVQASEAPTSRRASTTRRTASGPARSPSSRRRRRTRRTKTKTMMANNRLHLTQATQDPDRMSLRQTHLRCLASANAELWTK
jgi:hypothetical protein